MGRKIKKQLRTIWMVAGHIGTVWSLIGMFGVVLPILVGIGAALVAFIQSVPPIWVSFSFLGGYTLAVTAVNQTLGYRQKRKQQSLGIPRRKPERIEHDSVLWEYTGKHSYFSGALLAEGSLCPKDYCLLSLRSHGLGGVHEEVRADNHDDQTISESHYDAILFCQECKEQYTLSEERKTIKQSRLEVEALFEAKHRREAHTKEI